MAGADIAAVESAAKEHFRFAARQRLHHEIPLIPPDSGAAAAVEHGLAARKDLRPSLRRLSRGLLSDRDCCAPGLRYPMEDASGAADRLEHDRVVCAPRATATTRRVTER